MIVDPSSAYGFVDLGWLACPAAGHLPGCTPTSSTSSALMDFLQELPASPHHYVCAFHLGESLRCSAFKCSNRRPHLDFSSQLVSATIFMGDYGLLLSRIYSETISLLSVLVKGGTHNHHCSPLQVFRSSIPSPRLFAVPARTSVLPQLILDTSILRLMAHGYNQRQAVLLMYGWTPSVRWFML